MALAEAQPADARRQALERDALAAPCRASGAGARCPGNSSLTFASVRWMSSGIARQRDPAERPLALAEQRPDVRGHEAGKRTRSSRPRRTRPGGCCCRSRTIGMPSAWNASIASHVHRAATAPPRAVSARVLRRIGAAPPASARPSSPRQVAVDEVVRGGLVGDHVGPQPPAWRATSSGSDLGGVAEQADRHRLRCARSAPATQRERVVEVARLLVEVARAQPHLDARLLALDRERSTAPAIVAASGCAPPMPPSPAVRIHVPASSPPKCWRPASAKVS